MKNLLLILFLCTGCVWGQQTVSSQQLKKTFKSLKAESNEVIVNNDLILKDYVDSSSIENALTLIVIADNFTTLDNLEAEILQLFATVDTNKTLKPKHKRKYENKILTLLQTVTAAKQTQTAFFQMRLSKEHRCYQSDE